MPVKRSPNRGNNNRHGTAHPTEGDRANAKATRGNETYVLTHDGTFSVQRWAELNFPAAKLRFGDVANQLKTGIREEFVLEAIDPLPALPERPVVEPLPLPGSPARQFTDHETRASAARTAFMLEMSIYDSQVI
jgi:hypothetical protein